MASANDSLLPQQLEDFRDVKYWDSFFKERQGRVFEWYGDWRSLRPVLQQRIGGSSILNVGCGNSALSAEM